MKWHILRRVFGEVSRGHGLVARRELSALRSYREMIDKARGAGGDLNETAPRCFRRERLLEVERRWYGPAIEKAGKRAGVDNLISFLAARGIPQVVISDYEAEYKLESLGLAGRFASIYVGEQLGFVKPSPKIFRLVATEFNIPAGALLHFGDRIDRDGAGALAAGCQCLTLGRDFRSFDDLLQQFGSVSTFPGAPI
jgi:HAD superfamily hydrolase (TIGR01549 family)